jgi:hypothetical protein
LRISERIPAFSHCFLKRFIAFSKDSPSLTRTPVIQFFSALSSDLGFTAKRKTSRAPSDARLSVRLRGGY